MPNDQQSSFNASQLLDAARFALSFLDRPWFGELVPSGEGPALPRLLLEVYRHYRQGLLISKTDAARLMGVETKMTALRHIGRAKEMGLVTDAKALDQRVHLLIPTDKGLAVIEEDLARIARQLKKAAGQVAVSGSTRDLMDRLLMLGNDADDEPTPGREAIELLKGIYVRGRCWARMDGGGDPCDGGQTRDADPRVFGDHSARAEECRCLQMACKLLRDVEQAFGGTMTKRLS
jgi:hypothetical protein